MPTTSTFNESAVTASLERFATDAIYMGNGGAGDDGYDPAQVRADIVRELRYLAGMLEDGAPIPAGEFAGIRLTYVKPSAGNVDRLSLAE